MHRTVSAIMLALALSLASQAARAFIDPPTLSPANPTADQAVGIDIYAGGCDTFFSSTGVQVTQNGNAIRMLIPGVVEPDGFCFFPPFTYQFTVGTFLAGSYTLQVDRQYQDLTNKTVVQTLGVLPLIVSAAQASAAATPALNPGALVLLAMLLAIGGYVAIRSRSSGAMLILLALGALPVSVRAQQFQYLQVLLVSSPGAPTPDQVINYFSAGHKGTAPLTSLAVENPQAAKYLLPIRASGDFLTYLQANPGSPRAMLERYIIVQYAASSNLNNAMSALASDHYVEAVYAPIAMTFSSATLIGFGVGSSTPALGPVSSGPQYGRDDINIDAAWQLAGGYALVGDIDSGLYVNHPALRQFSSTGQYLGGGFSPANSFDISSPYNPPDANVDELKPGPVPDSVCNPNNLPALPPAYAGHGTHVSGLIAANASAGLGVAGTCKHCAVGMWKIAYPLCNDFLRQVVPQFNFSEPSAALTYLSDSGAQIVNMSFGTQQIANYCASNQTDPFCVAIAYASGLDIAMTAAAGNGRTALQFPASDSRVIDAGGFEATLALWDLSPPPPNTTNCPPVYPVGAECGSNYTTVAGGPPQEMMASANQVLSTAYPGYNWNNQVACGDQYPGPGWGNGVGWCTGTSMSAPQIAGVVGILRSINPLVPVGIPNPNPLLQVVGIRAVLARTTFEAQANQPLSPTFGYGHPDAAMAARKMLGTVAGRQALNRVTPLFRLYSSATQDYADTTSPQTAIALNINQPGAYVPQGQPVPGYANFPSIAATPKASVYVLTTEYTPQLGYPPLIPIYQMDRSRNWPLGCTGGSGCNTNHRDFTLMTTTADVQQAHADGFNLRNIQGYIYQTCSPEPTCIPPGAQKFYRECNTTIDDCATFLESERITFEGNGYTSAYPATSSKVLGYAYPNVDTDGDGFVDGMEYVIGTSPTLADSNGDGTSDGTAYPQAGVPVSDPCLGAGAINCPANFIFRNGFQ